MLEREPSVQHLAVDDEYSLREQLSRLARHEYLPGALFALTTILTYGYEIFNFNLSLDETLAGTTTTRNWSSAWISQGRWFTGVVDLVLPNAIGPTILTGLGVALSAFAWWTLCRHVLLLTTWPAAVACSLAITMPIVALGFTFVTFALALGVGQVLVLLFLYYLKKKTLRSLIGAAIFGMLALGTYDSFAVSIFLGIIILAISLSSWRLGLIGIVVLGASALLSRIIGRVLQATFRIQTSDYTTGFFNLKGFIKDPVGSFSGASKDTLSQFLVARSVYEISAPWVSVLFVLLAAAALLGHLYSQGPLGVKAARLLALGAIFIAAAFTAALLNEPPLRSLLYLPFLWLALLEGASRLDLSRFLTPRTRDVAIGIFAVTASLAVVSQSIVDNRIFAASAVSLAHDRSLAYEIERQSFALGAGKQPVPALIWARDFSWPASTLSPKVENEGISLFTGESPRGTSFLSSQGIAVRTTSESEASIANNLLRTMPTYPKPGWIRFRSGILVIKLTDTPG